MTLILPWNESLHQTRYRTDLDDTFMVATNLGDGNTETGSKTLESVDGIRLIDTTAKKWPGRRRHPPCVGGGGAGQMTGTSVKVPKLGTETLIEVTVAGGAAKVTVTQAELRKPDCSAP